MAHNGLQIVHFTVPSPPLPSYLQKSVGDFTARYIMHKINEYAPTADRHFVLGCPTGGL